MINDLIARIEPARRARASRVRRHLDQLTKPPGSLGRLEHLALRLALIYGDPPPPLRRRAVFVAAADHGVASQRVSAYPAQVTVQMCRVLGSERAAINTLARATGTQVFALDVGVNTSDEFAGVRTRRVRRGTRDFSEEAAMLPEEVATAIRIGHDEITRRSSDLDIVGIGELGIGNTTAAAALTAALLRTDVNQVVGSGTGIDELGLARKRAVVQAGVARLPGSAPPLQVLGEVGGLEIAALVGVIIGAASAGKAIVIDGFVATSAALVAVKLHPPLRDYLIAAHLSPEPGHRLQLRALRLRPLLDLRMRLGEGTGAALVFPIVDAAGGLLREMATFADAGISEAVAR